MFRIQSETKKRDDDWVVYVQPYIQHPALLFIIVHVQIVLAWEILGKRSLFPVNVRFNLPGLSRIDIKSNILFIWIVINNIVSHKQI